MYELYVFKAKQIGGYGEFAIGIVWDRDKQYEAQEIARSESEHFRSCDYYLSYSVQLEGKQTPGMVFDIGYSE